MVILWSSLARKPFWRPFLKEVTNSSDYTVEMFEHVDEDMSLTLQLKNRKGLIPSNFVEEVAVASPLRLAAAKVIVTNRELLFCAQYLFSCY